MSDSTSTSTRQSRSSPAERVRPLVRVRQFRDFTPEPIDREELGAIADVARWSGSSQNTQPWRFILIQDVRTLRRIAEAGMPQTRGLTTAPAAIAITMPDEPSREVMRAFDEGRAAERILAAASMLGLGAGISWIQPPVRPAVREMFGLPEGRTLRTIVAIGHPTEDALRRKSAPGKGRLSREEVVFEERWPQS